ncbi:MAG: hypothetical protein HFJ41_02460 [Clostridia bacterium]|nr:hypothetical protein [Clostridia bacterium]
MGDSFITIIAIFLAAVLMFVFPLMAMSERTDDISELAVQTATTDFVDNVRTTGKLTTDDYDKFMETIASTGNSFDVDIELQILDENPGVKTTQAEMTKIGENLYYKLYTSQVEEKLDTDKRITLKEGDMVSVTVRNTNQTISQILKNFFYQLSGNDTYQITAQNAGIITVNGSK